MKTSHNVLKIESMQLQHQQTEHAYYIKATLFFKIEFYCPVTGKKFKEILLSSVAKEYEERAALRTAVENFFNGNTVVDKIDRFDVKYNCVTDYDFIHHLNLADIQEPYKSMFSALFTVNNWIIPKALPIDRSLNAG